MEPEKCPECGATDRESSSNGMILCAECGSILDDSNYEPPEPDVEAFRGNEAEAYRAEVQSWIQRNLK